MIKRIDMVEKNMLKQNREYPGDWLKYGLFFILALFSLLPRLDSYEYFLGKYLWGEDGNIFLNQARELGFSAIFQPYAGYLHLYPRLVTEIAQFFEFVYQPSVMLLGWFIAYLILIHSLLKAVLQEKGWDVLLIPLVFFVALQPSNGDVFFTITNSQWMLGTALCLYVIADTGKNKPSWIGIFFLFILTLTGPFSLILIPVLILKLVIRKDWRDCKRMYLIVSLGALIQLIFLLSSDRISSGEINKDLGEWFFSFLQILNFGADNLWTTSFGILIWLSVIYLFFSEIKKRSNDSSLQTALMLLMTAFLLIAAGLFSHKDNPAAIVHLGGGNRYTWGPYTLILTCIILLIGPKKRLGRIILYLFTMICLVNFQKVTAPDLQFEAYAKFSEIEDVTIPLYPRRPSYPGWHIAGKRMLSSQPPTPLEIEMKPGNFFGSGIKENFSDNNYEIIAESIHPMIILTNAISCPDYSHAGLNIYFSYRDEGWIQLFWSSNMNFNENESLRRWYPSGNIKAQFAFPLDNGKTYVRLDPMENIGSAAINKIELYCLR